MSRSAASNAQRPDKARGRRSVRRVHRVEAEHTAKRDGYVLVLADQRDGIFNFDKSTRYSAVIVLETLCKIKIDDL